MKILHLSLLLFLPYIEAYVPSIGRRTQRRTPLSLRQDVTGNNNSRIQGCSIVVKEGSTTEWIVKIDGVQADLGRFSQAIYKKITDDAKRQRFQGFRPGTIPPHLEPTYRAFAMDECARETTFEALEQNNIRPFESSRAEVTFEEISFLPQARKKKSKGRKKKQEPSTDASEDEEAPSWIVKDTLKEAIDAGWRPGQSFSFVAKNVKGQQLKDQDTAGAEPLGLRY